MTDLHIVNGEDATGEPLDVRIVDAGGEIVYCNQPHRLEENPNDPEV